MKKLITTIGSYEIYNLLNQLKGGDELKNFLDGKFSVDTNDEFADKYHSIISVKDGQIVATYRYIPNAELNCTNTEKYYNFSDIYHQEIRPRAVELGRSAAKKEDARALFSILKGGLGPLISYNKKYNNMNYLVGQVTLQDDVFDEVSQLLVFSAFWQSFGCNIATPKTPSFSKKDLEKLYFLPYDEGGKLQLESLLSKRGKPKPTLFYFYKDLVRKGIRVGLPTRNDSLKGNEMWFCVSVNDFTEKATQQYLSADFNENAFAF